MIGSEGDGPPKNQIIHTSKVSHFKQTRAIRRSWPPAAALQFSTLTTRIISMSNKKKPSHRAVFTGKTTSIGVGFTNADQKGINVLLNLIPAAFQFDLLTIDESTIVEIPAESGPVYEVLYVNEFETAGEKKTIWTKIGTASYVGSSTARMHVELNALPTNFSLVLREHKAKPAVGEQAEGEVADKAA